MSVITKLERGVYVGENADTKSFGTRNCVPVNDFERARVVLEAHGRTDTSDARGVSRSRH